MTFHLSVVAPPLLAVSDSALSPHPPLPGPWRGRGGGRGRSLRSGGWGLRSGGRGSDDAQVAGVDDDLPKVQHWRL